MNGAFLGSINNSGGLRVAEVAGCKLQKIALRQIPKSKKQIPNQESGNPTIEDAIDCHSMTDDQLSVKNRESSSPYRGSEIEQSHPSEY